MTSSDERGFGADLTVKQFAVLLTALGLGTLLEWYDFFVYGQLNGYLTKVFFPSSNESVQQLAFWGVYAVGFIARPLGSVFFGHIGDTRGRRVTLLISICVMAIPTVLIGCLPTYSQVGIAAPALLAVLRLIQGLAMGGEFGSALVYLHEVGPAKYKGITGAFGFATAMFGCICGVAIVVIMEAIFTPSQMLQFGWRIPFLISSISASAALALRLHMPEPAEFSLARKAAIQSNLARVASHRRAYSLNRTSRSTSLSSKFSSIMHSTQCSVTGNGAIDGHQQHGSNGVSATDVESGLQQHMQHQSAARAAAAEHEGPGGAEATMSIPETIPESAGHYVPIVRLLRTNVVGLLLQVLFEAWVSIGFYVVTTWLPVQMRKSAGMSELMTQIMLIVNLVVMGGVQLLSGLVSDKGLPRLWSSIAVLSLAAVASVPILMGISRGNPAGSWLLHTVYMTLLGWALGIVPATCSSIYDAAVRASGFNLGHNIAMSWLGGVAPTIVTALVAATGSTVFAPGILLACAAVVSMLAVFALLQYAPAANRTPMAAAAAGSAKLGA